MTDLAIGTLVQHDRYGEGIVAKNNITSYDIFFAIGGKVSIAKSSDQLQLISTPADAKPTSGINLKELQSLFDYLLDKKGMLNEVVEMAEKWEGGTLNIIPGNKDLQGKEVPIEVFFHKIVMVRDKLRVLEQNINSHPKLTDQEKVDLQQYITKAYGSLTTFNILFSDKEQYFKGSGKA